MDMDEMCEPLPPQMLGADMRPDSERAMRMTHRKFNKHMAEKRRRARINRALEQMKTMVLKGMHKDPEHYDKMEKADILDLTVKYLTNVVSESAELSASAITGRKFRAGYTECLKEVDQFLNTVAMETSTKTRVVEHLSAQTDAHAHAHAHAQSQLEAADRFAMEEAVRRREATVAPLQRIAAPTAVVAPVHVVAPHSIARPCHAAAGSSRAFAETASPRRAVDDTCQACMGSRLKPQHHHHGHHHHGNHHHGNHHHGHVTKEMFDQHFASTSDVQQQVMQAENFVAHAASQPNMIRPIPIDLRHKYFQVADRCVPVPLYDSMWRPWDRPVSV